MLSLTPTHIVHLLVLAEHSPTTNALTDRPNPANNPYKLKLMQYPCHSVCFLPVDWTQIPLALSPGFSHCWTVDCPLLIVGLLFVPACLGVLSDEDPSVVPSGAAGMSLHPWASRLPGGMYDLWSAPTAAATAASLQHHGECVCVSLLMRAFDKCVIKTVC